LAVLYTPKDIHKALQDLRIDPINNTVTTKEAARILTWRASNEGIEHDYPESAVRRRTQRGHLTPAPGSSDWAKLYRVEDVFKLPLYPKRGSKSRSSEEAVQEAK